MNQSDFTQRRKKNQSQPILMFKVKKMCGENVVVGLKIKQVNLWKSFQTTFFGLFSTVFSIVVGKILVRAAYSFPVNQQNNKGEKRTATS